MSVGKAEFKSPEGGADGVSHTSGDYSGGSLIYGYQGEHKPLVAAVPFKADRLAVMRNGHLDSREASAFHETLGGVQCGLGING